MVIRFRKRKKRKKIRVCCPTLLNGAVGKNNAPLTFAQLSSSITAIVMKTKLYFFLLKRYIYVPLAPFFIIQNNSNNRVRTLGD